MIYLDQINKYATYSITNWRTQGKKCGFFSLKIYQKCSAGSVLTQVNIFLCHEMG